MDVALLPMRARPARIPGDLASSRWSRPGPSVGVSFASITPGGVRRQAVRADVEAHAAHTVRGGPVARVPARARRRTADTAPSLRTRRSVSVQASAALAPISSCHLDLTAGRGRLSDAVVRDPEWAAEQPLVSSKARSRAG